MSEGDDDSGIERALADARAGNRTALFAHAEFDPDRPSFKRIVSPTRKFTGDNADAIYFETEISAASSGEFAFSSPPTANI